MFLPLLEEHAVWEVWRGFEWVFGCVPRMGTIGKSVLLAIRKTFLARSFNVITSLYGGINGMMIVMYHVLKFAYARFGSHTVAERSGTVSMVTVGCTRECTGNGVERFVP